MLTHFLLFCPNSIKANDLFSNVDALLAEVAEFRSEVSSHPSAMRSSRGPQFGSNESISRGSSEAGYMGFMRSRGGIGGIVEGTAADPSVDSHSSVGAQERKSAPVLRVRPPSEAQLR